MVRATIRPATITDAPAVAAVLRSAFVEYEHLYTAQAFAATTPAPDQVRARIAEGPVWVGLLGGEIVATVAAVVRPGDVYIRGMAVLPNARGLAIGWSLLEHTVTYAWARARMRLTLSTTPFLLSAIRLYEHFGFSPSETGPYDLFGTPLFTMTRPVPAA